MFACRFSTSIILASEDIADGPSACGIESESYAVRVIAKAPARSREPEGAIIPTSGSFAASKVLCLDSQATSKLQSMRSSAELRQVHADQLTVGEKVSQLPHCEGRSTLFTPQCSQARVVYQTIDVS